jgi:transposase
LRQLIRSAGAKLVFLPKYFPDLNPIEQSFAKLEHLLRKASARTVDAVCAAIGHARDALTLLCSTRMIMRLLSMSGIFSETTSLARRQAALSAAMQW